MCHGQPAKGYLADEANALSNQDFLASASDEFIIEGILDGRPGTAMSAWGMDHGSILTREDASAILSFIRSWQKEPSIDLSRGTAAGNSENGAKIYEKSCAECHGKSGGGGKAIQLNNPVFQQTASDAYIRYAIENGRRQTPMRAYKTILSSQDINDLIVYIHTFKIKRQRSKEGHRGTGRPFKNDQGQRGAQCRKPAGELFADPRPICAGR